MATQVSAYQEFAQRRERLLATLATLAAAFRRLGATERADALTKSQKLLQNDTFKVMFVGEFKNGKSTLINALLGQSLLPAKVAPCTGVITRIRYDDRKRVVLARKDKQPPLTLSLETAAAELAKYVTIKHDSDNPYSMAFVFYPLALCRNNVEIVDSPGLNEHKTRTQITKAFFAETDAMVMVLNCEKIYSEVEARFIEVDLQGRDLSDIFFVCNRWDAVHGSPQQADEVRNTLRRALEPRVGPSVRIHYVSGRDALEGRQQNQPGLLARSNIPQFEAALERFLSTERGRVKLRTPLRQAETAIREGTLELIPHRESLLRQPLEEIQRKLEQQRPQLEAAEKQKEQVLGSVDRREVALTRDVEAAYRTLTAELEAGLRRQADLIKPSTWQTIGSRKEAKEQVVKQLEDWVTGCVKKWKDGKLAELFEFHMKELGTDLDSRAAEFLKNLDTFKAAFGANVAARPVAQDTGNVSAVSRLIGGGLGLLVGGPGSAVEGAAMGTGHMAKGLGVNIAVGVGLLAAGFSFPVVFPALVAVGLWRTLTGARRQIDQLRHDAVEELLAAIRSQQTGAEQELQAHVKTVFARIRQGVSQRMSVLVDEVRGQVQAVIQERTQHEDAAEQQLAALAEVRQILIKQAGLLEKLNHEIQMA